MPYIDFDSIKAHPKWFLGASDPTNLLFPVTCHCDIATIYGFNAGYLMPMASMPIVKAVLIFGKETINRLFLLHQTPTRRLL